MGQKPRLDLRVSQRPVLSAGQRAGLDLLTQPAADLRRELEREALDNPFLLVEPAPALGGGAGDAALATLPERVTLARHLQEQILCMDLDAPVAALARYLAEELDPRGLLPTPDHEIAAETGTQPDTVAAARRALQSCDPPGIAASDLGDRIRLQLLDAGEAPGRAAAIRANLPALADGRFAAAARALDCTADEARRIAATVARLSPDPAATFATETAPTLVPELVVRRTANAALSVALLDDPGATVTVDESLAAQSTARGAPEAQDFVAAKLADARRIRSAVRFRARTLLAVGQAVVEAQSAHFLGRARAPAPLTRAAVATRLGLHPSTVGRAIRGRALLFGGQVQPLATYFPAPLAGRDVGPVSSAEIRARIRDMVSRETAETVLSDKEIAHSLGEAGVDIARRTVAKYRKCMAIPNSSERRRSLARRKRLREAERPSLRRGHP